MDKFFKVIFTCKIQSRGTAYFMSSILKTPLLLLSIILILNFLY